MNKTIMRNAGFGKEVDRVETATCPICEAGINIDSFRDEISKREYGISGLCQSCQDDVFGEDPVPFGEL